MEQFHLHSAPSLTWTLSRHQCVFTCCHTWGHFHTSVCTKSVRNLQTEAGLKVRRMRRRWEEVEGVHRINKNRLVTTVWTFFNQLKHIWTELGETEAERSLSFFTLSFTLSSFFFSVKGFYLLHDVSTRTQRVFNEHYSIRWKWSACQLHHFDMFGIRGNSGISPVTSDKVLWFWTTRGRNDGPGRVQTSISSSYFSSRSESFLDAVFHPWRRLKNQSAPVLLAAFRQVHDSQVVSYLKKLLVQTS